MNSKIEHLQSLVAQCCELAFEVGIPFEDGSDVVSIRLNTRGKPLARVEVQGPPATYGLVSHWSAASLDYAIHMAIADVDKRLAELRALATGAFT